MAISDKNELFSAEPLIEECTLGSGKSVLLKAMTPKELEEMRAQFRDHPRTSERDGIFLVLQGLIRCVIHPQTHAPLLSEADIPRMETQMHSRDFQPLLYAFNRLHGFEVMLEGDDIVKKLASDSAIDISGIVSQVNSESRPSTLDNMPPTNNSESGTHILRSKTTQPTTEQPS